MAAEQPEKLAELQRLFVIEATKYNVLPLDDRRVERFNPDLAGRPQLVTGSTQLLFGGMGRLSENSIVVLKNKSYAVTAAIDIPDEGAEGVIVAQEAPSAAGRSTRTRAGRRTANLFGLQRFKVYGEEPLTAGEHQVRVEFAYDGGGLGKGGTATLYVDGEKVGEGRVEATVPMVFSADETTDIGSDTATPVTDDLRGRQDALFGPCPLGADRSRRRRRGRRPPDRARGALPHRDGAPVSRPALADVDTWALATVAFLLLVFAALSHRLGGPTSPSRSSSPRRACSRAPRSGCSTSSSEASRSSCWPRRR